MKKRILKWIGYCIGIFILLLILLYFALQTSTVQNYLKDKILSSLSEQYNAEWSIGDIEIHFFDALTTRDIRFLDPQGDTLLVADKLDVDISVFSLLDKQIDIDEVSIEGANVKITEYEDSTFNFSFLLPQTSTNKYETNKNTNSNSSWSFHLDDLNLYNSKIKYRTPTKNLEVNNKQLNLKIDNLDLDNSTINLDLFNIESTTVVFDSKPTSTSSEPFTFPNLGWKVTSNELTIAEANVKYNSGSNQQDINDINLTVSNLNLKNDGVELKIDKSNLQYKDDLQLNNLSGEISIINDDITGKNISLNTTNDLIEIDQINYNINSNNISTTNPDVKVSYTTLKSIESYLPITIRLAPNTSIVLNASTLSYQNNIAAGDAINLSYGNVLNLNSDINRLSFPSNGPVEIKGKIQNLNADLNSLDKVFTNFEIPDSLGRYKTITLNGNVDGSLKALTVSKFNLKIDDAINLNLTGNLQNLDNIDQLRFDANVQSLATDVSKLPLPKMDAIAIDSIGKMTFAGAIRGTLNDIYLDGKFTTEIGDLTTDLNLVIPDDINNISYQGQIALNKFQLGTFLKNEDLSTMTIETEIDGQGLNFEKLNTKIKGRVKDFVYLDYEYSDIIVDAKINNSEINGKINIDDENVKFDYDGIIKIGDGRSTFNFTAKIDTINLQNLGFYADDLALSGDIKSKFSLPLRQGENGEVIISDFIMSNPNESFREDTILLLAEKKSDSTFVELNSDFAEIAMTGQFGLRDLPNAMNSITNYYYKLDSTYKDTQPLSDNIQIKGKIVTLQPLDVLLGKSSAQVGLIGIDLGFTFKDYSANGNITIDSLIYNSIFSENINIDIATENSELAANLTGTNNIIGNVDVPIIKLDNIVKNQIVSSSILASDQDNLPRLKVNTTLQNTPEALLISLSDSLIINKKDWLASKDNSIKIFDNKVIVENFRLTDNNEYLTVSSLGEKGDDFNIEFENFNIGQFTSFLTTEPSKLSGNINGGVELRDVQSDFYFLINLKIEDIIYDSTSVGVLTLEAEDNPATRNITSTIDLVGKNNDLTGSGTFNPNSRSIDYDVEISSLQMFLLDPFMSSIMKNSSGELAGSVKVDGTLDLPKLNGEVNLDDVVTTIVANNARYGIDKHKILFNNTSIDIGTLDIFDENDNVATLSGKIYHSNLSDMDLDIEMSTDKFIFLNTSSADNPVFNGKMVMNATADITGPPSLLNVDVVAKTLDNTSITISPFSATGLLSESDFIKYGKPDEFEDLSSQYLLQLARQFPFKVNILLDATNKAKLNLIVDPVTGDKIEGTGTGNLRIKLSPDGGQEIYGVYTVEDGFYSFSYGDFVNKKFIVKPGGTVKFNGNPLTAILNIDAVYNVYTTTYELIKNEISINDSEISSAQRRTNVEVYLSLNGSLEAPEILLDIQIPDLQSSNLVSAVERKLNELRNDPNELNNQVFGLLLFDSFLLSDNASSGFGNIGSNIALSSISNLISSQLNKLAGNVIKGVDVNVSVNSYDSDYINSGAGGNVTEIGLQVSKQLFNDRLKITAGGNVDLAENSTASSYSSFIGDFVLEYKLTESGRYRIRVFSKSAYDRILDENSNKNGVSLFFNRTFDSKTDDK